MHVCFNRVKVRNKTPHLVEEHFNSGFLGAINHCGDGLPRPPIPTNAARTVSGAAIGIVRKIEAGCFAISVEGFLAW
jgi:hypothetical protein